jgi:hypothetical protein
VVALNLLLFGATGGRYFHKKRHAAKAIPQQLRLDDRGRRDAAALDRQSTQNLKGGPVQTPRVPANEIGVPLKYFLVPTVFSQAPRKFFCKKNAAPLF